MAFKYTVALGLGLLTMTAPPTADCGVMSYEVGRARRVSVSGVSAAAAPAARRAAPAELRVNCGAWNTREFFETATVENVLACLKAGAAVTARGADGETPLHLAAVHNSNPAVTGALITAGANLSARTTEGYTPLHATARNANPNVTEVLLAAGAEVAVRNLNGATPLHVAAEYASSAVSEALLLAGADPMARIDSIGVSLDIAGATPLHLAARNANPAVTEVLLAAGTTVNAMSPTGTPLHEAAEYQNLPVVEVLLAAGADPRARVPEFGWTPLHEAAFGNWHVTPASPAVIEALLAAGADPRARDVIGRTPLHHAARSANENTASAIRVLVAAGADWAARDEEGNTPLHLAARPHAIRSLVGPVNSSHAGSAVEALLDAGANPTARNAEGWTPWDLAQDNEELKGANAYWRLNDARFSAPTTPHTPRPPTTRPES